MTVKWKLDLFEKHVYYLNWVNRGSFKWKSREKEASSEIPYEAEKYNGLLAKYANIKGRNLKASNFDCNFSQEASRHHKSFIREIKRGGIQGTGRRITIFFTYLETSCQLSAYMDLMSLASKILHNSRFKKSMQLFFSLSLLFY